MGDHRWGLTDDVHRLETPKLAAVRASLAAPRAPLGHGTPLPAVLEGNRFSASPRPDDRPGPGARTLRAGAGGEAWVSYTLRSPRAVRARITLVVGAGEPGRVAALWDGRPVGSAEVGGAPGTTALDLGAVEVTPGLHGLVVSAARGTVRREAVRVE